MDTNAVQRVAAELEKCGIALRLKEDYLPIKLLSSPAPKRGSIEREQIVAYRDGLVAELLWPAVDCSEALRLLGTEEKSVEKPTLFVDAVKELALANHSPA